VSQLDVGDANDGEAARADNETNVKNMTVAARTVAVCAALLVAAAGAAAQSGTSKPPAKGPDFTVAVDGLIVADFTARMAAYEELRRSLEEGLQGLEITDDASQIRRAEQALARRIRAAREGARQGSIFTPAINAAFKRLLAGVTTPGVCAAILEDNPGHISYRTNRSYPRDEPLSTVPPSVLGVLPTLPSEVQYRFVERHLILYDTRANLILDRIPNAVRCR